MILAAIQNFIDKQNFINFYRKKQDPTVFLPEKIVLEIFSHLDLATLGNSCLVSKNWKRLAKHETLWRKAEVYNQSLNSRKWAQWFGDEVIKGEDLEEEWNSLPWNIAGILQNQCPIFPGKKVSNTHILVRIPKTLNGRLTLKNLERLVIDRIPNRWISHLVCYSITQIENKTIDKSRWVLITKDVLPESMDIGYINQRKMIAHLAKKSLIKYRAP